MKVTMNMSNYEIEYDAILAEYDDEILRSGWNPVIDSVCQQLQLVPVSEHSNMPEGLATEVAELFLKKMYSYQR
jgi:hypothetical protein